MTSRLFSDMRELNVRRKNCGQLWVGRCNGMRAPNSHPQKSGRMVQGDSGQGGCRPRHGEDTQSVNLSMSIMASFTAADPLRIYFE